MRTGLSATPAPLLPASPGISGASREAGNRRDQFLRFDRFCQMHRLLSDLDMVVLWFIEQVKNASSFSSADTAVSSVCKSSSYRSIGPLQILV